MHIGIDVGGTKTAVGITDDLSKSVLIERGEIFNTNNFEDDYLKIRDLITRMIQDLSLESIGIALPGILSPDKSTIINFRNLNDWVNKPIVDKLEEDFKVKVNPIHDCAAAALGEFLYGEVNHQDNLFIIWGTGLSSAFVRTLKDDIVDIVSHESGFQVINSDYSIKTWGGLCSGRALERRYGKKLSELIDIEWNEILDYFVIGLYNLVTIISPKLLIIGGGVINKQSQLMALIRVKLKSLLEKNHLSEMMPLIIDSSLKADVGVRGALGASYLES